MRMKDMTNQRFGRWLVLHRVDNSSNGSVQENYSKNQRSV